MNNEKTTTHALDAYNLSVSTPEKIFQEAERLRAKAHHAEASAIANAERKEREKWQEVVTKQEAEIAELKAKLGE